MDKNRVFFSFVLILIIAQNVVLSFLPHPRQSIVHSTITPPSLSNNANHQHMGKRVNSVKQLTNNQPHHDETINVKDSTRKEFISNMMKSTVAIYLPFRTLTDPTKAYAASSNSNSSSSNFTPGGTLVDRPVGITINNDEASLSRKVDNSNVLFTQDYYYKFGNAPIWIEPTVNELDYPKTLPFVPSQQRYDALKKYKDRILKSLQYISSMEQLLKDASSSSTPFSEVIKDSSDGIYALRPYGLLANSFLASENTGMTNELLLCRWYINEIDLRILDIRNSNDEKGALQSLSIMKKAVNSYLCILNRLITAKVGDKFQYI